MRYRDYYAWSLEQTEREREACIVAAAFARAMAPEAQRAETVEQGFVHEGAGPQDIAQ